MRRSPNGVRPRERFVAKLRPVGRDCFIYGKNGSTAFWLDGKDLSPRVAAWFLRYGRMPKGPLRSMCGTRLCCNVAHLRDVTYERGAYGDLRVLTRTVRFQWDDRDTNPWITEVPCPVCGGPPTFGTCLNCEVSRAA